MLAKTYDDIIMNDNRFSVLTDDGYKTFTAIGRKKVEYPVIKLIFETGEYIVCTPDHKMYVSQFDFDYAMNLNEGDYLYSHTLGNIKITKIEDVNVDYVYDLIDVKDTHSFLVGKSSVKSSNCVYLDELAFVENDVQFYTSTYPVISSGETTKIIITSTPNGLNLFYKMWTDATNKNNEFSPYKVHWSEHPARDDKWAEQQIKNTSEQQFSVEYECSFQGSAGTLIKGVKLSKLAHITPIENDKLYKVYQQPQEGRRYCTIIDSSEGVGKDYSVINVIDISEMPYRQVFVYRDNEIVPSAFSIIVDQVARKYNESVLLVESNNSSGGIVTHTLWNDTEYPNMLMTTIEDSENTTESSGKKMSAGIRTTKKTKAIGCARLKDLIETDKLIVTDYDTIHELSTFIRKNGTYQAENNKNDDIVMTLVIFSWFTSQEFFSDYTGIQTIDEVRKKLMSEQHSVMAFISNGINDSLLTKKSDISVGAYFDDGTLTDDEESHVRYDISFYSFGKT